MRCQKPYQLLRIFLSLLLIQIFVAAQTPDSASGAEIDPASVPQKIDSQNEGDLVHFGDLVEIDIIGSSEYDWRGTLNPEGFLNGVPFVEAPVIGRCRSPEQISEIISEAYSRFLRDPKVTVRILDKSDRPTATLQGAVKNPRRFQIKRGIRLNELIIISGGLTDHTSGEIRILRRRDLNCFNGSDTQADPAKATASNPDINANTSKDNISEIIDIKINDLLKGEESANPQIISGDIINVLEAQPIYVTGGVENPTRIALRSEMTLTRAVASAGGLTKDADQSKITIFRRNGAETSVIGADLEKINTEQADDVVLQAFDIVDVSRKGHSESKRPPVLEILDAKKDVNAKLALVIID